MTSAHLPPLLRGVNAQHNQLIQKWLDIVNADPFMKPSIEFPTVSLSSNQGLQHKLSSLQLNNNLLSQDN